MKHRKKSSITNTLVLQRLISQEKLHEPAIELSSGLLMLQKT